MSSPKSVPLIREGTLEFVVIFVFAIEIALTMGVFYWMSQATQVRFVAACAEACGPHPVRSVTAPTEKAPGTCVCAS